jgi:dipeptidyl aminopeptidase/acylaminoacyl peptidase
MGLRWIAAAMSVLLTVLAAPVSADPPALDVYGRLPAYELAAMSPSGNRTALLGTVDGKRQLVVLEGSKPVASVPVGDGKERSLSWVGEKLVLLRTSYTTALGIGWTAAKAEFSNVLVIPLDGRKPWMVFQNDAAVDGGVSGYYGAIERGGRWYGYFSGLATERTATEQRFVSSGQPSLFEVDLDSHTARLIGRRIETRLADRKWIVGADGKIAATLDVFGDDGSWSIRTDRGTIASGKAPLGGIELMCMSADGQGVVYYIQDAADEGGRYMVQPVGGGTATELLPNEAISSIHIDDRTRRMTGFIRAGDQPEMVMLDPHQEKIITATRKAFPGVSFGLIDESADFSRLLVETSGTGDPQTLWSVDIKTGNADQLATAYPMPDDQVGPVKMFDYAASDGLAMGGVLTLPPGRPARNLPLVMLPHGGPAARDYPVFDWWAQAFASRGYAVFQPNFRGSTQLGAAFRFAGRGEWGRKMQSDLSDGLLALAKAGIIDPKRACIVGGSYGGYAALAGVTLQQGLYRCAVAVAGVADVSRMAQDDFHESGGDPMISRWLHVEIGQGRDLKAISPINFVDRVSVPVLLIHGLDDTVVHYAQSSDMAAALKRAGKPVELVTLKGEDHWLSRSETRLTMLQAAVDFVEKHNPPDPAPAK